MKKLLAGLCSVVLLGMLVACGGEDAATPSSQGASAGEPAQSVDSQTQEAAQSDSQSTGTESDGMVVYDWEKDLSEEAQGMRAQFPDGYLEIHRQNVEDLITNGRGLRNASDTFYYYRGWVREIVPIAGEEDSYYALIESDGLEDYGTDILFYTYSDRNKLPDYVYGVGDLVEVLYNESLRSPEDEFGLVFRFWNDGFVMGWGNKYPVTEQSQNFDENIITTGVFSHKDSDWYYIQDDATGELFAVTPHQGVGSVFEGEIMGERMRANQADRENMPYGDYLIEGDKVLVYATVLDRNNPGEWAVDRLVILESAE